MALISVPIKIIGSSWIQQPNNEVAPMDQIGWHLQDGRQQFVYGRTFIPVGSSAPIVHVGCTSPTATTGIARIRIGAMMIPVDGLVDPVLTFEPVISLTASPVVNSLMLVNVPLTSTSIIGGGLLMLSINRQGGSGLDTMQGDFVVT